MSCCLPTPRVDVLTPLSPIKSAPMASTFLLPSLSAVQVTIKLRSTSPRSVMDKNDPTNLSGKPR